MAQRMPHSKPTLGEAEAAAAAEAVRSGRLAVGERTAQFEQALAQRVGVAGAVATSSGTAALCVALKALGVGDGDEVLVPSFVCTALLHAVWAAGAEPVVCDIGDDYNLSPEDARRRLTGRTAAVILPHVFGAPAAVGECLALGPPVIEDCAQAIGAEVGGRACGSVGAASVFSFYATKMLCTGEGGALASSDREVLEQARNLIEYDKKHDDTRRFNLKFNDVAAAIGLVQLSRLDAFVRDRRRLAAVYDAELSDCSAIKLARPQGSAYYRYVIETERPAELISALAARGVEAARPVDPPLHRITRTGPCPNAERAWSRTVSLPVYPSLTEEQARRVAASVRDCLT